MTLTPNATSGSARHSASIPSRAGSFASATLLLNVAAFASLGGILISGGLAPTLLFLSRPLTVIATGAVWTLVLAWLISNIHKRLSPVTIVLGVWGLAGFIALLLVNSVAYENDDRTLILVLLTAGAILAGAFQPRAALRVARSAARTYASVVAICLMLPSLRTLMFIDSAGSREGYISQISDEGRMFAFTSSPNIAGALFGALLIVELSTLILAPPIRLRLTSATFSVIAAVCLLFTNSQTALLASTTAILTMLLPHIGRRILVAGSLILATLPAMAVLAYIVGSQSSFPVSDDFATGRGQVWRVAAELLSASPVTGLQFSQSLPTAFAGDTSSLVYYGAQHSHNQLLQFWMLGGIFAATFWLSFLIQSARRTTQRGSSASLVFLLVLSFSTVPLVAFPGSVNVITTFLLIGSIRNLRQETL